MRGDDDAWPRSSDQRGNRLACLRRVDIHGGHELVTAP